MKKIIKIDGMHCDHCKMAVENALNALAGVQGKVDLKKNQAIVTITGQVSDEAITQAIEREDFDVISITEKTGLFG